MSGVKSFRCELPPPLAPRYGACPIPLATSRAYAARHPQDDLQRGHWDDFKELRDTGGKLFRAQV
jgi:hypothetical protein